MDKKILGINKVISLIVLSAFLILIGCRERVEFTMSKDGSLTEDKYYLEKTKSGDIKIVSADRDSEFYIFTFYLQIHIFIVLHSDIHF